MTDPYLLTFEIDAVPMLENRMSKAHYHAEARHRRRWRQLVVLAVGQKKPKKPLQHARVTIDVWSRPPEPDPANLRHAMKPVLDGLQPFNWYMRRGTRGRRPTAVTHIGCGVIANDGRKNFAGGDYIVNWNPTTGKPHIRVTVEEVKPSC